MPRCQDESTGFKNISICCSNCFYLFFFGEQANHLFFKMNFAATSCYFKVHSGNDVG